MDHTENVALDLSMPKKDVHKQNEQAAPNWMQLSQERKQYDRLPEDKTDRKLSTDFSPSQILASDLSMAKPDLYHLQHSYRKRPESFGNGVRTLKRAHELISGRTMRDEFDPFRSSETYKRTDVKNSMVSEILSTLNTSSKHRHLYFRPVFCPSTIPAQSDRETSPISSKRMHLSDSSDGTISPLDDGTISPLDDGTLSPLDDSLDDSKDDFCITKDDHDCDTGAIFQTCNGVTAYLHDDSLWRAFSKCETEMIISRGGRRMFPHIVLSFDGLDPDDLYSITLEVVPADERRYKFINNKWMAMGMADPGPDVQPIAHSDSPNTGAYWAQNRASFSKVRLTNNKEASKDKSDGNILLLSMHKYMAVIKVRNESSQNAKPLVFCFDESTFIAVTAYQNYKITHLKIKNNPFAKAFRDVQNTASHRTVSSRRKEAVPKYDADETQKKLYGSLKQTSLPNPSYKSLYYPYNGQSIRPFGFGMPGLDSFNQRSMSMNQNVFARMPYLPWMTMSEHMPSFWLKNPDSFPLTAFNSFSSDTNKILHENEGKKDKKLSMPTNALSFSDCTPLDLGHSDYSSSEN